MSWMKQIQKTVYKLKHVGFKKTMKQSIDELKRPFVPKMAEQRWNKVVKRVGYIGITEKKRETKLIVSLTTYPARIEYIHTVIKSLLVQTLKPDLLILWLAEEQFPEKEDDLPKSLLDLKQYGLTISWCNDIRSYKKLVPTIKEYPEAVIITADDDMYYHPKMVERLYKAYQKEPEYIHCHRVTKFYMEDGEFRTIAGGYDIYSHPSYLHKLTGGSGSCYPPHSLHPDITKEELFMKLAPTNDDIWFWLMAAMNGMRCNVVRHSCTALYFVEGSQADALNYVNDQGERLFWKQLNNMFHYYPDVQALLRHEWECECTK